MQLIVLIKLKIKATGNPAKGYQGHGIYLGHDI
jgi:hypothetical protein